MVNKRIRTISRFKFLNGKPMYSYYSRIKFLTMVNLRIRASRDETSARLVWKESEPDVGVAQPLLGSVEATLQTKIVDV